LQSLPRLIKPAGEVPDPGYSLLMSKASGTVKRLDRAGTMSFHFVEDSDQTFSRRAPRERFLDAVPEHSCQRYAR
jgi:hypothetical protein